MVNHSNIDEVIEKAEALAQLTKCYIEIEDVPPSYVPAEYETEVLYENTKMATRLFDNGSTVHLILLAF